MNDIDRKLQQLWTALKWTAIPCVVLVFTDLWIVSAAWLAGLLAYVVTVAEQRRRLSNHIRDDHAQDLIDHPELFDGRHRPLTRPVALPAA